MEAPISEISRCSLNGYSLVLPATIHMVEPQPALARMLS